MTLHSSYSMADSALVDLKDSRVPPAIYWSKDQICQWIEDLGFPQYKVCFESNKVDGKKLILISASRLPDMGITDFKHIKIITKALRELLDLESPFWNRSISLPPRNDIGMYMEKKASRGTHVDSLNYQHYLNTYESPKWLPPLNNHCQLLPHH